MAYPTDKEEFRRVVNQDLPEVEGDIVDEDDQNLPADFLERLQDTLGYNIKMGYATVKAFFDYVVAQVATIAGKVSKTGDTMTGDLHLNNSSADSPKLYLQGSVYPNLMYIWSDGGQTKFATKWGFEFRSQDAGLIFTVNISNECSFRQTVNHYGHPITRAGTITLDPNEDFINPGNGRGVIVRTPDGTKNYKISVDNAGNVISTFIP